MKLSVTSALINTNEHGGCYRRAPCGFIYIITSERAPLADLSNVALPADSNDYFFRKASEEL